MIEKIDEAKCDGCGICVEICPLDTFRVNEDTGKAFIAYPDDCITCFVCEMNCPTHAIYVHPFKEALPMTLESSRDKNYGQTR
jgi:NAD-dependent dihydropyrimidine dehydrogenase PreA subunit